MGNSNDNRRIFSVAKEFEEVKNIIDGLPNSSRFICEAILEKYNNKSNPPDERLAEVMDKLETLVDKLNAQFNMNDYIELKVKETIQNFILANHMQALIFTPQMLENINLRTTQKTGNTTNARTEHVSDFDTTNKKQDPLPPREDFDNKDEPAEQGDRKSNREEIKSRFNKW